MGVRGLYARGQQSACHPEVHGEGAFIEADDDELAAPRNRFNPPPRNLPGEFRPIPWRNESRSKPGGDYRAAGQVRRKRANDGLDLG
jgi:hypothetical protein